MIRLQILHVPDCPGAQALDGLLGPLLEARPDIQVTWQVVTTEDEAGQLGMTGSPTILAAKMRASLSLTRSVSLRTGARSR